MDSKASVMLAFFFWEADLTAAQATEWMLPLGLVVAVLAGFLIIMVSLRTSWVTRAVALTTVGYAFLGGFLTLSPKWHSLTAKYDGKSGTIEMASLQKKLLDSENENNLLRNQISQVTQLGKDDPTAVTWIDKSKKVQKEVDWAKFITDQSNTAKVKVQPDDAAVEKLAIALGLQPNEVGVAFKNTGLTILKDFDPQDAKKTFASDLWVNPVAKQ